METAIHSGGGRNVPKPADTVHEMTDTVNQKSNDMFLFHKFMLPSKILECFHACVQFYPSFKNFQRHF